MTNPLQRSNIIDDERLVGQRQRPNSCVGICRVRDVSFPNTTSASSSDLSNVTVTSSSMSHISRLMQMTSSTSASKSDNRKSYRRHRYPWITSEQQRQERSPSRVVKRRSHSRSRRRISAMSPMWRIRDLLFFLGTCSRGGHETTQR